MDWDTDWRKGEPVHGLGHTSILDLRQGGLKDMNKICDAKQGSGSSWFLSIQTSPPRPPGIRIGSRLFPTQTPRQGCKWVCAVEGKGKAGEGRLPQEVIWLSSDKPKPMPSTQVFIFRHTLRFWSSSIIYLLRLLFLLLLYLSFPSSFALLSPISSSFLTLFFLLLFPLSLFLLLLLLLSLLFFFSIFFSLPLLSPLLSLFYLFSTLLSSFFFSPFSLSLFLPSSFSSYSSLPLFHSLSLPCLPTKFSSSSLLTSFFNLLPPPSLLVLYFSYSF